MRSDLIDVTVVLDRSGSMSSIREDTIGGLKTFIEKQKQEPGELRFTLVQFDNLYEVPINNVNVKDVNEVSFEPRGMTALLDAVGRAIQETGARLGQMRPEDRPAKVMFVIITDGQENASKEFKRQQIADMVKHQTDVYSWSFVFLGADQNSFLEAAQINIPSGNVMNFGKNTVGVSRAYDSLSKNTREVRTSSLMGTRSAKSGCNYFDSTDYADQAGAGADNSQAPAVKDASTTN